jgi:zinc protease
MVSYHIPAFAVPSADTAALTLIDQLLFADSAPLFQELVVKNQWVDFIRGGSDANRDPSLFTVFARVKSEDLVPKVKETVDRYFRELQEKPVDPQRLERIKSHLRYGFALTLDTPGAVAEQAAQAIAVSGDIGAINASFEKFRQATPADIQRMAKSVFQPQNETYVTLSHKSEGKPAAQGSKEGGQP